MELFLSDCLLIQVINNSISLKRLSAIDDSQYSLENTCKISEFELNQINWDRILCSGTLKLCGSQDNLKWDIACFDHVVDLENELTDEFIRLCFKLNTQRPKNDPMIVLKKYTKYLGIWHLLKVFTIHWSEIPLLQSVIQKHVLK